MGSILRLLCKVCGYEWVPRVENPIVCPKCKSRNWNKSPWEVEHDLSEEQVAMVEKSS